jgi:hypothetical protein
MLVFDKTVMLYNLYILTQKPRGKEEQNVPREVLERLIIESVRLCPDLDLLDLILRLLSQCAK